MAKRTATSDLNQDNWNEEETGEELGVFRQASQNELKMRTIKRAKRRGLGGEDGSPSVFKEFKGFGGATSQSSPPTFSFLSEDGKKPSLTNPNPFPSFSFSNTNSPTSNGFKDNQKDNSPAKSPPGLMCGGKDSSSDKDSAQTKSPILDNNKENMLEDKSGSNKFGVDTNSSGSSFKFGIESDKTNNVAAPTSFSNLKFCPAKNGSEATVSFKFGIDKEQRAEPGPKPSFKFGLKSNDSPKLSNKTMSNSESTEKDQTNAPDKSKTPSKSTTFLASLKSLNIGVLNWVKEHLNKNYYVDLSPVFDDYKHHLTELYKNRDDSKSSEASKEGNSASKKSSDQASSTNSSSFPFSSSVPSSNSFSLSKKSDNTTKNVDSSLNTSKPSEIAQVTKSSKTASFTFGAKDAQTKEPTDADSGSKKEGLFSFTGSTTGSKPVFSFGSSANEVDKPSLSEPKSGNEPKKFSLTFGASSPEGGAKKPAFTFGASTNEANKPTFTFGATSGNSTSLFTFGSDKPKNTLGTGFGTSESKSGFTFGNINSTSLSTDPTTQGSETKESEETYEPPKDEVKEFKEDDAFYEKKVKLFYKMNDQYIDKGVGNLFLKPAGEKCQLIIRALTNLGTILLNIILNSSLPTQRVGKNNVLLVCVPNPPIDSKAPETPVSMLIRVKTSDDADELLSEIEKQKSNQQS